MLSDDNWEESPSVAFPRVTFCDFDVRRLGNTHRYTVQCTLPINMFTEKIYMFLWFWFVLVATISALSLLVWVIRACLAGDRIKFVKNHLLMWHKFNRPSDHQNLRNFVENYLCQDGVFILRLIAHNTNNITVTEITCALWKRFNELLGDTGKGNLIQPTTYDESLAMGDKEPPFTDTITEEKKLLS